MAVKQQISQQTGQRQQLRLSQQQLLVASLLEGSIVELEDKVKKEIESNPALEEAEPYSEPDEIGSPDADDSYSEERDGDDYASSVDYDVEDYDDQVSAADRYAIPEDYNSAYADTESLTDYLDNQVDAISASEKSKRICHYIIGSLDDDGYLQDDIEKLTDDLNIYQGLEITQSELLEAVILVQSLDPAGVCARSVNECLRLQAERRMSGDFSKDFICRTAVAILDEFFDDFTAKRYDRILKRVEVERTKEGDFERITREELDAAIEFIQGLNPHPCHIYTDAKYLRGYDSITPDFYYDTQSDHLTVSSGRIPALSVSKEYTKMLEQVEKLKKEGHKDREGSEVFLRDRIESAQQFIDAIAQRNATLSKVMTAIIKVQRSFFSGGCDDTLLQPLTMKQVAEMAGCDISTVSRVANSKYIDVDHQYTFRLKHFFSEGITTQSGETVSNKMIMETIKSLVEAEDKSSPLTDDAIAATLNKQGYNVARRTVAKYRGTLGIPSTRERAGG